MPLPVPSSSSSAYVLRLRSKALSTLQQTRGPPSQTAPQLLLCDVTVRCQTDTERHHGERDGISWELETT